MGFLGRLVGGWGTSNENEVDLKGQLELSRELFLEIDELRNEKSRIAFSRTMQGRVYNILGYFFSIYCLYKIIMVCSSQSHATWHHSTAR